MAFRDGHLAAVGLRHNHPLQWTGPGVGVVRALRPVKSSGRPRPLNGVALYRPSDFAMDRGIRITRLWSDDDMVELRIEVSGGTSRFVNQMYVGHRQLADAIAGLDAFKTHIHGGLFDLCFGEFGCEYAGGAFHARFHFPKPGRLFITSQQESDFEEFGKKSVASCATIYLTSEPALLDRFIEELKQLPADAQGEAHLEAV